MAGSESCSGPGPLKDALLPHAFRVTGVFFLLYLALGHLPALFALQAGLGDIAAGIAAPLVALRLAQGTGPRAAVWFNVYGLTDLAAGITLGALTGYGPNAEEKTMQPEINAPKETPRCRRHSHRPPITTA